MRHALGIFRTILTNRLGKSGIAALLAVVGQSTALAADIPVNLNFTAGTNTSFSAVVSGTGTFSVSGTANIKLTSNAISGSPISATVHVNLPNQTKPIALIPNPTTATSNPSGTGQLSLQDYYTGQRPNSPAVPDGLADDGAIINSAMSGTIAAMDLNILSSYPIALNSVTVTGNGSLDILGLITVNIPLTAVVSASAALNNITFDQTGAALMGVPSAPNPGFADGAHSSGVPSVQNLTVQYGTTIVPGTIGGSIDASIGGSITADLGIFGSTTQDLGALASFSESLTTDLALIFDLVRFTHVDDGLNNGADDLRAFFSGSITLPLGSSLSTGGTQALNLDFDLPVSLGFLGTITLDGDVTGNLFFALNADLTISSVAYSLRADLVQDIVNVPEASTLAMLSLVGLTGTGFSAYRRRKRKV